MHPPVLIIRMERVIIFKVNRRVEVVSKPFAYVCVCVCMSLSALCLHPCTCSCCSMHVHCVHDSACR